MLYSDYCKYAPQTRYPDFDHVKKQMYKVHAPHREAGYITKVEYQQTQDAVGAEDWEIFYTPGPKAFMEFRAFTNQLPQLKPAEQYSPRAGQGRPEQTALPLTSCDPRLLSELTRRGIAEIKARDLLASLKPRQEVMDQLEYVDAQIAKDRRGRIENPPRFVRSLYPRQYRPTRLFLVKHVNESRVSQIKARAISKLRVCLQTRPAGRRAA